MFTSRAEFRLHLRIDNADRRLTPYGRRLGLIDEHAWQDYEAKQQRAVALEKLLATRKVDTAALSRILPDVAASLGTINGQTYAHLLKRPEITIEVLYPLLQHEVALLASRDEDGAALLSAFAQGAKLTARVRNELKSVETEIKFAGYLDQQRKSIEKLKGAEKRTIPAWFDYANVSGLSREMQEKLARIRPQTIGQASRIPGVTPAALSLVNVFIEIQGKRRQQAETVQV
jgi:tRNA uridine 5-carboxymethylaminomethyl modification enzyme